MIHCQDYFRLIVHFFAKIIFSAKENSESLEKIEIFIRENIKNCPNQYSNIIQHSLKPELMSLLQLDTSWTPLP